MFLKDIIVPNKRVIIDNDFGGDPDGLVQLAHHLLSPSVEIRGIIGSFFKHNTYFGEDPSAAKACKSAHELLSVMGLPGKYPVYTGADEALLDCNRPVLSEGAELIINEAMQDNDPLPLFVLCGASLTTIASALLIEPAITDKLTLVWIGGPEYSETARKHTTCPPLEFNMGIDIRSAQVIFNSFAVPTWQVPRDTYRQVLMSYAELYHRVRPRGELGKYLTAKIEYAVELAAKHGILPGEAYVMGDSPLVLLSALDSVFDPGPPVSSSFVIKEAPLINDRGLYENGSSSRNIRIYTALDSRLLLEDLYAKLTLL